MTVSVQRFLTRYPEFTAVNTSHPERIEICIEDALTEVPKKQWTNLWERGVCALAAHLLVARGWNNPDSEGESSPLQAVASEAAGALSVSYVSGSASETMDDEYFSLTAYGQEYIRLRRLTFKHILVAR